MSSQSGVALFLTTMLFLAGFAVFGEGVGSSIVAQTGMTAVTPSPTPQRTPTAAPATATPTSAAATFQGVPAGFTVEGNPFLGSLDAAVMLHEYSDYLCPFCARHFRETYPLLLENYIASGDLLLVFHDFPLPSLHPTAYIGHRAARCVAAQDAAAYWTMHDLLFERQNEWNHLPDPTAFVTALAAELEVDADAFAACMDSDDVAAAVEAGVADGDARGFNATPSFLLERPADGYTFELIGAYPYARFAEVIDAMLAGEEAPAEPTPEPPQLPYWAGEGLTPDPDRSGFTLAGDPYKGSEDAPLTIVEFSDFQCPACATHALDVQPQVDAELIETGKVRWVFKHFPLRIHPQAFAAATAAECAGDQGAFWPMHDLLFARQEDWGVENVDDALAVLATELAFDVDKFAACTASRQALERVLPDLFDAQGVVTSTPTFIVLDGGRGVVYQGVRSATEFIELITQFLESLESAEEAQ
jgi:protein-disulfide isomerase